jgi:hypothetical protein
MRVVLGLLVFVSACSWRSWRGSGEPHAGEERVRLEGGPPTVGPELSVGEPHFRSGVLAAGFPRAAWGSESWLAVWASLSGINASRVRPDGSTPDPAGVLVTDGVRGEAPDVASDGTGWLAVWQEQDFAIHARLVDADGQALGMHSLLLPDPGPYYATGPTVAFDGESYGVVWMQHAAPNNDNLYGVRIDSSGTILDANARLLVPNAMAPELVQTPSGALLVWIDRLSPNVVRAARMDRSGGVLDPGGFVVTTSLGGRMAAGRMGTSSVVAWADSRNAGSTTWTEIYAARIDEAGALLDPNGVDLGGYLGPHGFVSVCENGQNASVAWDDTGGRGIGAALLGANGSRIPPRRSLAEGYYSEVAVAAGPDGPLALWTRDGDVTGARLDASNQRVDFTDRPISQYPANSTRAAIGARGSSWLVTWLLDSRPVDLGGSLSLYAARVTADGTVLDPEGIFLSFTAVPNEMPAVAGCGSNWLVAWVRGVTEGDVYAMRVDAGGTPLEAGGGIRLSRSGLSRGVGVACDGDRFLVAWTEPGPATNHSVVGTRVGADGVVLDRAPFSIATEAFDSAIAVAGGDGGFLVEWTKEASAVVQARVTRVASTGTVLDPAGLPLAPPQPGTAVRGIAFVDSIYLGLFSRGNEIVGTRVTPAGTVLDPNGISVGNGDLPFVTHDGEGFLATWLTPSGIDAARVSTAGVVLDSPSFTLHAADNRAVRPVAAGLPNGSVLVAYEAERWGDWTIKARVLERCSGGCPVTPADGGAAGESSGVGGGTGASAGVSHGGATGGGDPNAGGADAGEVGEAGGRGGGRGGRSSGSGGNEAAGSDSRGGDTASAGAASSAAGRGGAGKGGGAGKDGRGGAANQASSAETNDPNGCGCSVPGSRPTPFAAAWVVLGGLLVVARRRFGRRALSFALGVAGLGCSNLRVEDSNREPPVAQLEQALAPAWSDEFPLTVDPAPSKFEDVAFDGEHYVGVALGGDRDALGAFLFAQRFDSSGTILDLPPEPLSSFDGYSLRAAGTTSGTLLAWRGWPSVPLEPVPHYCARLDRAGGLVAPGTSVLGTDADYSPLGLTSGGDTVLLLRGAGATILNDDCSVRIPHVQDGAIVDGMALLGAAFDGTDYWVLLRQANGYAAMLQRLTPDGVAVGAPLEVHAAAYNYFCRVAATGGSLLVACVTGTDRKGLHEGLFDDKATFTYRTVIDSVVGPESVSASLTNDTLELVSTGDRYVIGAFEGEQNWYNPGVEHLVVLDEAGAVVDEVDHPVHGAPEAIRTDGSSLLFRSSDCTWVVGLDLSVEVPCFGALIGGPSREAAAVATNGRSFLAISFGTGPSAGQLVTSRFEPGGRLLDPPLVEEQGSFGSTYGIHMTSNGEDFLAATGSGARRFGAEGAPLDPAPIPLPANDNVLAVASDGRDYLAVLGGYGLRTGIVRLSREGDVLDPTPVTVDSNWANVADAVYDGSQYVLALSDGTSPIRIARVSQSGAVLGTAESTAIGTAALAWGRAGGLLAWSETITFPSRLFVAPIEASGVLGARHLVTSLEADPTGPTLAWDGNQYWLAWHRYPEVHVYFHDLHVARIAEDGAVLDPEGVPVFTSPLRDVSIWEAPNVAASNGRVALAYTGFQRYYGPSLLGPVARTWGDPFDDVGGAGGRGGTGGAGSEGGAVDAGAGGDDERPRGGTGGTSTSGGRGATAGGGGNGGASGRNGSTGGSDAGAAGEGAGSSGRAASGGSGGRGGRGGGGRGGTSARAGSSPEHRPEAAGDTGCGCHVAGAARSSGSASSAWFFALSVLVLRRRRARGIFEQVRASPVRH